MSVGGSHLLRVMGGLNESNGGRWRVVARGAHGTHDGFHGHDSLQVADHFNGLDWHGQLWRVEARWRQMRRTKVAVAVAGIGPGVSHGIIGDWEAAWWLGAMVAMVAAAECGPRIF